MYGPPSSLQWNQAEPPALPWAQQILFLRSTVSALGNWVPIKSLKGEGKKKSSQKRKCHQSCSPAVALSPDCLSERDWKEPDSGSVSSKAANGNSQECGLGQPGAVSTATFTRRRLAPLSLAGQLGDVRSSLSLALPQGSSSCATGSDFPGSVLWLRVQSPPIAGQLIQKGRPSEAAPSMTADIHTGCCKTIAALKGKLFSKCLLYQVYESFLSSGSSSSLQGMRQSL